MDRTAEGGSVTGNTAIWRGADAMPYWWEAMRAQGCRCYWCGVTLSYERAKTHIKGATERERRKKANRGWTVEHFLPGHVAPTKDPYYIVLACQPCNADKGHSLPGLLEILAFMQAREVA